MVFCEGIPNDWLQHIATMKKVISVKKIIFIYFDVLKIVKLKPNRPFQIY